MNLQDATSLAIQGRLQENNDNKVDQLINSLLDAIPKDYSYGILYKNKWEYILNDLRSQKRTWNKQLRHKDDSKYSTSFIEANLDIINKAIDKVQNNISKSLNESFSSDEELIDKFKTRAPNFYNICQEIDKLGEAVNIKVTYNTDQNKQGTFNVNITIPISQSSIIKCELTSKGTCITKANPLILDDNTIDILSKLNKILAKFTKYSK